MKPDDDPITFMLPNAECYRCLMDQHLVLNKIVEVDPAPEYLQTFREQLMRPRYIKDLPVSALVVDSVLSERSFSRNTRLSTYNLT